jgi:hypothetical protein
MSSLFKTILECKLSTFSILESAISRNLQDKLNSEVVEINLLRN